jgi:hypothetical protein
MDGWMHNIGVFEFSSLLGQHPQAHAWNLTPQDGTAVCWSDKSFGALCSLSSIRCCAIQHGIEKKCDTAPAGLSGRTVSLVG